MVKFTCVLVQVTTLRQMKFLKSKLRSFKLLTTNTFIFILNSFSLINTTYSTSNIIW
jgi:hypothetical protein